MNEMQLKEALMEGARNNGICAEGYGQMRGYDRDGLIRYYLTNPDWCMERGFPSLELLRREFSDIEDKGVFVGKTFDSEVLSEKQVYVFHDCMGTVRIGWDVENAIIPMLYCANGCDMVFVSDNSDNPNPVPVPVYVFGENEIKNFSDSSIKFTVYSEKVL